MTNSDSSNQPIPGADVSQVETAPVEAPTRPAKRKRSAAATQTSRGAKQMDNADTQKTSKAETVLNKLRSAKGATIDALVEATGWQAHSVRGFLSGTVKKKRGLAVESEVGKDGLRRYRIANGKQAG